MAARWKGNLLRKGAIFILIACFILDASGDAIVPNDVVYTDVHKTVPRGDTVVLKCQFQGDPIAVYWKKGNNLDDATNLITWIEGRFRSGSCLTNDACSMDDDDFSLTLEDVQVADQGRYICRISNYLGILLHNFTDVKIYAPPMRLFPLIKECPMPDKSNSTQMCIITSNNSISISCIASRYYPNLDLFFLHNSQKIKNLDSNEWTNEDGTKNKSIQITGTPSDESYVCVASNIPGLEDQQTATVSIRLPNMPTTIPYDMSSNPSQTTTRVWTTATPNGSSPAKIVVPIVFFLVAAVTVAIILLWWKRRNSNNPPNQKDDVEERVPMVEEIKVHVQGSVSYYELWSLAYDTPGKDMVKVRAALSELGITGISESSRRKEVYDDLCQWKEKTKPLEQAQMFRDALERLQLVNRWQQIYEKRRYKTAKISEGTLEQILRDLSTVKHIQQFLSQLIPDRHFNPDVLKDKDHIICEAMDELREWNSRSLSENPFVLISLALEKAGFNPIARTFFEGILSFYELRSLLFCMNATELSKVPNILRELEIEQPGEPDVERDLSPQHVYDVLCKWKEQHNTGDQAKILRDALEKADCEEVWPRLLGCRRDYTTTVSDSTLHQILVGIDNPDKVDHFLSKLILGHTVDQDDKAGEETVVQKALETLREWMKGPFDEDPFGLLSRALEKSECNPVDRNFYYVVISYYELWTTVPADSDDNVEQFRQTLRALGLDEGNEANTHEEFYVLFCKWKDEHPEVDQLLTLKVVLERTELQQVWTDLQERRCKIDGGLHEGTLEYILWNIEDRKKINDLLRKLRLDCRDSIPDVSKPMKDVVKFALKKLKQWVKEPLDKNPVVLLSQALERVDCKPLGRTFFRVPVLMHTPIIQAEVKFLVQKLTNRHCKRLVNIIPDVEEKKISDILNENVKMLFDTQSMLSDWIHDGECSPYEKRCRLDDVLLEIGRHDMKDFFGTIAYRLKLREPLKYLHENASSFSLDSIFDDDLTRLSVLLKRLPLKVSAQFCEKVGISVHVEENRMNISDQQLRAWRDNDIRAKSDGRTLNGCLSDLTDVMKDTKYGKSATFDVQDEELETIALFTESDELKQKLLSRFGLDVEQDSFLDQLKTWRNNQEKGKCREALRNALGSIDMKECIAKGAPSKDMYQAELVRIAFSLLMTDVLPVIKALGLKMGEISNYRLPVIDPSKGYVGLLFKLWKNIEKRSSSRRQDLCIALLKIGYFDVALSTYLDLEQSQSELYSTISDLDESNLTLLLDHLDLAPEQLVECRNNGVVDAMKLVRVWKSQIRYPNYHYRVELATALKAVGCEEIAKNILAGDYRSYKANEEVVNSICSRPRKTQTVDLCNLLDLQDPGDPIAKALNTVRWINTLLTSKKFKSHKQLSNKMFEAGFQELAEEIMILDYCGL